MMGHKERSLPLLTRVSLEGLVPANHFYRHLDQVLDLSFVCDLVQNCYASCGRPSVDPIVFFKLQLVMFFEGVRSERHLMDLVGDRLRVRWYLGYNLDELLPDHSSLTRIRSRYGVDIFRRFFEAIVEQCQQAGLVWGRKLYFDATHVLANASLDSLAPRFAADARSALQEHLTALFPDDMAGKELAAVHEADHTPSAVVDTPSDEPAEPYTPTPLPVPLPEGEREALTQANAARHDWIAEEGRQRREVHGRYLRTADVRISTTEPDATPLRLKGGGAHLGYQTHYVVDGGKRRIILGVLVTPSEVMENQPMLDLAWHVRFRWKLHPRQVTGDTKYGTEENIQGVEDMGIRAYMPLESANLAEVKLAEQTLDTIGVPRPRGRPKRRPHQLVADRGYDSSAFRSALRRRSIRMCIPPKRRPATWKARRGRPVVARTDDYRLRYTVERSFAWLGNFRRLLIRWEHLLSVYRSFFVVGVLLLCVRRL